ncbi:MAG: FAD-dependent oxidoreductase [Deltaproteobacteria bacterium]|nr:FAD-dependent oxidoreductase [Deltaproteobacteria bacterium]MBW2138069.1 FAD-dependent oxidoreductase [Deltaproteobacteria bacterium]
MKVIVVGGGWSGCAAALSACKQGAETIMLERTDMLLGTGLVGGIMRNNGRFTAAEEMIAMSGGEIFQLIDGNRLHRDIEFPGHHHASLYNVATMEPIIKGYLLKKEVKINLGTRITDVEMDGGTIKAVLAKKDKEQVRFQGDVFIDTTGTAGGPANCNKYGNGCAMCVLRCHSFGGRVSVAAKAGVKELIGKKGDRVGAMSGACKILKESLSPEIRNRLDKSGVAVVPLPQSKRIKGKLEIKACQQYALKEFEENIVLLNTGHAKLMSPFFPLDALREIPGLENARYEDPYAGGIGNSIRYVGMAPRDDALKVEGVTNLFCAGEKAGLLVGHTEAICTGTLAGYNAARFVRQEPLLVLPGSTAIGDAITYVREKMQTEEGLGLKYTFSGSVYFERMKERSLYSTDISEIEERVNRAGLLGIFGNGV